MNRHLPYDLYLLLLIESGVLPPNAGMETWLYNTVKQKRTLCAILDLYEIK